MSKAQFTVGDVLDFFREVIGTDFDGRALPVRIKGQTSWKISINDKVSWILGFQAGAGIESEEDRIMVLELINRRDEPLFFVSEIAFCALLKWTSAHKQIPWSVAA